MTAANEVSEITLEARRDFDRPWQEIELAAEVTDPTGTVRVVPAFWDGARSWRVRYSSPLAGTHRWRSVVGAAVETGLEGQEGELEIEPYAGDNPLLRHGAPVLAGDGRHLAHADGTPFLWLGDTWWSALTARFRWPDVFLRLADDRAAKGFNVVQLVAGFVPEFAPFSADMASEGGQPWTAAEDGTVNPGFWTVPDRKIAYLVERGIAPCVVGAWGYWAGILGREWASSHWRYVIARYAAYPVVWCVAGEVDMLLPHGELVADEERSAEATDLWEEVAAEVAALDPFGRLRTVHPDADRTFASSEAFRSREAFELDMLQTGHSGRSCVPRTMATLSAALAPGDRPVVNGECSYEGIFDSSWQDVQRFLFWSHMLSGAAGHTYGTMAISSFNSREDPRMPLSRVSIHFWEDAIEWPGAVHVGVGRRILEGLGWTDLQPDQSAIEPAAGPEDWLLPFAARLPGDRLLAYVPGLGMTSDDDWGRFRTLRLRGLRPDAGYRTTFIDPRGGDPAAGPEVVADGGGDATLTSDYFWVTPTAEDWVLLVEPA